MLPAGYLQGVLRGTRSLYLKEARSIATTLRKEYGQMFIANPGNMITLKYRFLSVINF
jgi:hypothetical protein